jgi:outer membrane protein
MKLLRRLAVSSALAAALALAPAAAHAEGLTKIAVVDVQRAVMQTEEGLRAQATLKKLFDNRQQELNKKQNDLQKQRDDLEKQKKVLSQEAFQKRAEDLQKQFSDLQMIFVEYNKELEKKQKEMTDPIVEKVMNIVKRLAARDGYDVVIDRGAVAFVRGDLDLTDQAIQMYNSGGGGGDAKAPEKK